MPVNGNILGRSRCANIYIDILCSLSYPVRVSDQDRPDADGADASADDAAVELLRSASRFTRTVGRVPGVTYSSVAWRVLSDLEYSGPARISELAQQQRVAQPTMTSLVQRLEGEGWVAREPDASDGRAILVRLTDAGSTALHDYRRAAAARIVPLLAGLDEADRATLVRASELMQRLSDIE